MLMIGRLNDGRIVTISENSPNEHIVMYGISGTGKSTRISELVTDVVSRKETVLAFDINGSDYHGIDLINRISARNDGINLKFFPALVKKGSEEYVSLISSLVDDFTNIYQLGVRQQGALREAFEYAIEHRSEYSSEMDAIKDGLILQDSGTAQGVYSKLWSLLECNVFRESRKKLEKNDLNVIDFQGLPTMTQRSSIELVLGAIWRMLRTRCLGIGKLTIVIDEFQNLSLKKGSVLFEMLREARKYGVRIILATQSMGAISRDALVALNQTAIQLYFKPSTSDMRKVAERICPENPDRWLLQLKKLRVGQAVAVGDLCIGNKDFGKPIIVNSCNNLSQRPNMSVQRRIY